MCKIRQSFVANSSSSSFIVPMKKISELQLEQIYNHLEVAKDLYGHEFEFSEYDRWHITVDDGNMIAETYMDNFDMNEFMIKIGINDKDIEMGDY